MNNLARIDGEYCVRVVDMPPCAKACVTFDENDYATIFINARLSHEQRIKEFRHELRHILRDDIHNNRSIRAIERREE